MAEKKYPMFQSRRKPISFSCLEFPGLVTFNDGIPNVYEGDLEAEEEVLDWLIEMKVESHIELITRPMLENMVEEIQYLAVFFCKCCHIPNFKVSDWFIKIICF